MDVVKIGSFIASLRREKKMTQKDLAGRLGVSDRAVSKWERGLNLPDASLFEPLCRELDISVSELLRGERETPTIPQMEQVIRDTVALAQAKEQRSLLFKRLAAFLLFWVLYLAAFAFVITDGPLQLVRFVQDLADPPTEIVCSPPRVKLYFWEYDFNDENSYSTYSYQYVDLDRAGCWYLKDSEGNYAQAEPVISQAPNSAAVQSCYTVKGGELNRIYFQLEGGYGCDDLEIDVIRYPTGQIGGLTVKDGWHTKFWRQSCPVPGQGDDYADFYYIDFYPNEHYFAVVLTWGDGYYAEYPFFTTRMEE